MNESDFFHSAQEELGKKKEKEKSKTTPLTAEEHEDSEERPMSLKEHWLSLRQSIQEKIIVEPPTAEEEKKTKLLSELITPGLLGGYNQLLREFNDKTQKSDEHQREFIDINSEEWGAKVETWIENLIGEVRGHNVAGLNEGDIEDLRAQSWMLFDSIGSTLNTRSLEKDIEDFYKEKPAEGIEKKEQEKQTAELVKELQKRYPLDQAEMEIMVDLARSENEKDNYSPKILVETIQKLWQEYNLGEQKGAVAKISLGYLLAKGAESFAPSLFEGIISQDKFNVMIFLEYFGLNKISEVISSKTDIELAKLMNGINHQINERITDSLFFQEFEFIHEKSLGEIFATLERGKGSTGRLLEDAISRFVPILSGIGMSLAFLTKINPILGGIGLAGLPAMYKIAKKQNEKIWPMYEKERREGERIATQLGSIKSGFEEVKTSPETPAVAQHVKEQMNTKDTLSTNRLIEEIKMRLKRMIPFDVSTVVSASIGGALQAAGEISGGAVLSNIIYAGHLNRPVQDLVDLYFNRFSRYVQDIQRMDEILGEYEKLDLPEGEKEAERLPVSALKNFDISIKDLRYKNILRGVSLDVKQGEFLTIAGASGAGKSTLLRNLVGLYKSDAGEIAIGGVENGKIKRYGKDSIYSVMSYCNQNPQIFEGMTLRENLLLWSKEEVNDPEIERVLRELHLDKLIDRLDGDAKNLSGGEKVRIGVARTLIKGAKIMLLDEPTASLDSQAATEVRKVISEINAKYPDTTIICVSHDEELLKSSKRSVNMAELQN